MYNITDIYNVAIVPKWIVAQWWLNNIYFVEINFAKWVYNLYV